MKTMIYFLFGIIALTACKHNAQNEFSNTVNIDAFRSIKIINPEGKTIKTRFNPPEGYERDSVAKNSFASYLQHFPLKAHGTKVYFFNGNLKNRQDVHAAVLDISIGKRDLQQCADAIMRLRAEYLYKNERFSEISFHFTNGFKADYKKWKAGKRIKVSGNQVSWVSGGTAGGSRSSFHKYLNMVFSYAGTISLRKEMKKIALENAKTGDIFIQAGSPGHAVIIMDMATNAAGEKMVLLAQSYMPAQNIHILKNMNNTAISPWYNLKDLQRLSTPEWDFDKEDLRRF